MQPKTPEPNHYQEPATGVSAAAGALDDGDCPRARANAAVAQAAAVLALTDQMRRVADNLDDGGKEVRGA